jgi:F-type H+-transporting ATPase subunit alpha
LRGKHPEILDDIRKTGDLTDATSAKLKSAVDAYAKSFA